MQNLSKDWSHYVRVCRSKYKKEIKDNDRSNMQSARHKQNKKTTNVHLVVDDSEILEAASRQNIPWIDSICIQS